MHDGSPDGSGSLKRHDLVTAKVENILGKDVVGPFTQLQKATREFKFAFVRPVVFRTCVCSFLCPSIFIFPSLFRRNFLLTRPQVFNSTIFSACIARNFSLEFSLPTLEPVTFVLIFLAYAPIHCRFTLRLFLLAFKTPFFFFFLLF